MPETLQDILQPILEIYMYHTQSWRYQKWLDVCTVLFLKLRTVAIPNLIETIL